MAANRAPRSRASAASAAAFLLALTASTRKRVRARLSRSMVLAPIEPVAPSNVTVRSVGARFNAARMMSDFMAHHSNRPRPGASRPPRANPISTAARLAVTNPSSRSISPPCPGMRRLESLASNRRLRKDSKRSPACAKSDNTTASMASANHTVSDANFATTIATATAASKPPSAPAQVFFGLTCGMSLGPPTPPPKKMAQSTAAPTHEKKKDRGTKPPLLAPPQADRPHRKRAGKGNPPRPPPPPLGHCQRGCGKRPHGQYDKRRQNMRGGDEGGRQRKRRAPREQHGALVAWCHQRRPFPQHAHRRDAPKQGERPPAKIGGCHRPP